MRDMLELRVLDKVASTGADSVVMGGVWGVYVTETGYC